MAKLDEVAKATIKASSWIYPIDEIILEYKRSKN